VKRLLQVLRQNPVVAALTAVFLVLGAFLGWTLLAPHSDWRLEVIRKSGYPLTLADLEAWYPPVPDAENAALIYTQAFAQPGFSNAVSWQEKSMLKDWLPPRGQVLNEEVHQDLKDLLAAHKTALGLLYSARSRAHSHYPLEWNLGLDMPMPHVADVKGAVALLCADALLQCAEGNAERAVQALLAAGHAADSLSAEPLILSVQVRMSCWGLVIASMERVINALPLTEGQLASLQVMVREAERPQALARALGGQRAQGLALFIDPSTLARMLGGRRSEANLFTGLRRAAGFHERDKAFFLDAMATNISIAELSWPQRFQLGQQAAKLFPPPTNRFLIFSSVALPGFERLLLRDASHAARVRVAQAGLAAQRFRIAHTNALPASLRELEPTWLHSVPADPYDGQPLRFRGRGSGFVVYSVGTDGHDDQGAERDSQKPNTPYDIPFSVDH